VSAAPFVHPTAIVEPGVHMGPGTSIWDHVHVRGPSTIGSDCIVGGKSYLAYGVEVGDRVKINSAVYICNGVTIEDGVMVSAGVTFTNDRYPRATDPSLKHLRTSEPDEHTQLTVVRRGATIGAGAVIGSGLEIGPFAMVGMGSVVLRTVPAFHLVVGNPARSIAVVCRCGEPVARYHDGAIEDAESATCPECGLRYSIRSGEVAELNRPS